MASMSKNSCETAEVEQTSGAECTVARGVTHSLSYSACQAATWMGATSGLMA